jgi:hypothetical protein
MGNQEEIRSEPNILDYLDLLDNQQIYIKEINKKLSKLESLCKEYKAFKESYLTMSKEAESGSLLRRKREIFEEAMKLMLGDGIIDYLEHL